MRLSLRTFSLASLLLVALAVPAVARQRVCGTVTPSPEVRAEARSRILAAGSRAGALACTGGRVLVAFHVVTDGTTGDVTQQQLDDQIAEINSNYASQGLHFVLSLVDRTDNASWFHMNDTATDYAMKRALAVDPAHYVNIYTCNPYDDQVLGYTFLPFSLSESDYRQGVVLHHDVLPGGAFTGFNLGRTATHEIGHYFGLYHTFENGCLEPGDEIDDTPYESDPASGCPIGLDTCPQDGLDPIHNYMDYSDDACYTEFTPLQAARMCAVIATYRPSLLNAAPTPAHRSTWGHLKSTYR